MHYVMLIYETAERFAGRDKGPSDPYVGAWQAYYKALVNAGVYVGGEPLLAPDTATTLRPRDGRPRVYDGPYAETKEQLGGFILIDVPSHEAALEWAARCPTAADGAVEVRAAASAFKDSVVTGVAR